MKLVGGPPHESSHHLTSETQEIVTSFKKHEDNQDVTQKIDNELLMEGVPAFAHEISSESLIVRNAVSTDENQIDAQFAEASLDLPNHEARLYDKNTEVFTDKNVTQVIDGASQIFKDICIDESSRILIKRLVEEIDANEMISYGMESSATHANSLIKDGAPVPQSCECAIMDHESSRCLPEGEKPNTNEKTSINISHQKISLQQLFLLGESHAEFDSSLSSDHKFSNDDKQISDQKNDKEVSSDELCSTRTLLYTTTESIVNSRVRCVTKETPEVSFEEECSESRLVSSDSDLTILDHSGTNQDSNITKLENEVTSSELRSGLGRSSCSKENTDSPQVTPVQTSVIEEPVHDSPKASARKLVYEGNHVSMNLSGQHYLACPKDSSGHIAYCGNTSMHSESSTTSTRSFAFPILQSEWNTSPVKMAKAKPRHFRMDQWLRTRLFCCKF